MVRPEALREHLLKLEEIIARLWDAAQTDRSTLRVNFRDAWAAELVRHRDPVLQVRRLRVPIEIRLDRQIFVEQEERGVGRRLVHVVVYAPVLGPRRRQ